MGSKDKTISFRVREERFEALQTVSEEFDESLSQVFRDFVAEFNKHDGRVDAVPAHTTPTETTDGTFPTKVEVSSEMIREHERLELEVEHLRESLSEYKSHASHLETEVEESEAAREDLIVLEDLDSVSNFKISTD